MTQKILLISDTHQYSGIVKKIIESEKPDVIIDAGDHDNDSFSKYDTPYYLVEGNHEPSGVLEKAALGGYPKVTLLEPGVKFDLTKGNKPVRVAGFGKNYSPNQWQNTRAPKYMHQADFDKMKRVGPIDILVTHEAPKKLGLVNQRTKENVGIDVIDQLINILKPKLVISGHHHTLKSAKDESTIMFGLPSPNVGYGLVFVNDNGGFDVSYVRTPNKFIYPTSTNKL